MNPNSIILKMEEKKLDNPTWYSLTETHKDFCIDYNSIKFYHPDFCPFGASINSHKTSIGIEKYASLTKDFYVVGDKPIFNDKVLLNKELVCNQMLLNTPIILDVSEHIIELQTENQKNDLFNLVNAVQPGYFRKNTFELGRYYGIYKHNKLVAVAGERMKMKAFTEVSAVVTHPDHIGKGYAKQLTTHTSNRIFSQNKIPFLHVAETNVNAINLYEKLGFKRRRKISFLEFHQYLKTNLKPYQSLWSFPFQYQYTH